MLKKLNCFIVLCMCVGAAVAVPQFWKLNTPSERELFIMDVKTTMSAGICYKQVEAKVNDPEVRMRTVSYCCPGYNRNRLARHSLKCDPICNDDCDNGICAAPDVCECFPGYIRENGRCASIY
ncbi:platelet endothelial aggregation receptor 1 [Stomoxys calcitrans]|uniref:TIL domain-containing protein n=1 Tax=Stomoxys calcitrans TaxID=35570 RepID=A0A1I8Q856_STOCA|nr:platelet endothelial aggregation receptor 1 [Stomoxys calcitrans]